MLTVEPKSVSSFWTHGSISFKHIYFWCPFLNPHLTTYHSNTYWVWMFSMCWNYVGQPKGPWRLLCPSKTNPLNMHKQTRFATRSLKGWPLGFHMVGLKHLVLSRSPITIRWTNSKVHKKLHWICYLVSTILIVLLNTNVKCSIVSPTLNINPTLFVIPCNFILGYSFTTLQLLSLTKQIFIQISIIHDNISSQVVDKRR
jgi:hypothetical protein